MSNRSFVLIANPNAGRGQCAGIVENVAAALRAAGGSAECALTRSIEHATELATHAAQDDRVAVAVGGDGLLRAVAQGASRFGGTVGITTVAESIRILLESTPHPADGIGVTAGTTGSTDGSPAAFAIGNVYVGFDSLTNVLANRLPARLGSFAYTYAALEVTLTMPPLAYRLHIDGVPLDYTGIGVTVASSVYYGGGVPVAPGADVHDGALDVIVFEQVSRRSRIATMLAMRHGKHLERPGVQYFRAQQVSISVEPPIEAYSDGDPIGRSPLTARVLPGAINLLRPSPHPA